MINGDYHQDGKFTMTGGTVDGNKAYVGEGGGIYIQGTGEISKGQITNNETYTFKDLGGGGIYIEADGTLTLTNAIITNNTANGFGGGIAGCVHGKTIVYAQDGAAIYKNTALGKGHTEGYTKPDGTNNGSLIDGYTLWAGSDIFKEYGQDIFAAGDATKGAAGIIVGNDMLGGQSANWEGYTYCYALDADGNLATENGQYILELTKVTNTNNGAVFGNRLVFLTSNPDQAAIDAAVDAMNKMEDKGVLISGNLSANTHGGGIANNGMLIIGKEDKVTGTNSYRPEIDANKTLTDTSDNSQKDLIEGQFTFELVDENEKVVGTVSNLGNGKTPNFEFPADTFTKKGTYTFTVREVKGNDSTIDYDGTVYQITIVVTEKEETVRIGNKTIVVTTLTVGDPLIQKINDKDGNAIDPTIVTSIDFNNTYTPEKKDPPPPSTEDGEDPKDPPEDPEDPGEDIPDPEVPLAPPPEEEITEPEVPLAPPPEEEVEIPEEPVPLADVPATGDISILWYAAALMSACGLAVLNLFKKKTEE